MEDRALAGPGGHLGQAPLPTRHHLPHHLEHYSCLAYISFFFYPFLCKCAPVGSSTKVMLRQEHVRTETSGVDDDAKHEADLRWGHVSCSAPSLFYEPAAFQTAARGQDGRRQSSTPHPGAGT